MTAICRHGGVPPFWRPYYTKTIAAPPPSRGHTSVRPQIARRHAAACERASFSQGKHPPAQLSMNRNSSTLTNLFVSFLLLRVSAPQLRPQLKGQHRGQFVIPSCLVFATCQVSSGENDFVLIRFRFHLLTSLPPHPTYPSSSICIPSQPHNIGRILPFVLFVFCKNR